MSNSAIKQSQKSMTSSVIHKRVKQEMKIFTTSIKNGDLIESNPHMSGLKQI